MAAELEIILKAKDEASKAFKKASGNLDKATSTIKRNSESFKKAGTAMTAAGAAGAAGFAKAISAAANYDKTMKMVQAVTGASSEDMAKMGELAKSLGSETMFSASEVAKGFQKMGMAGMSTKEILEAGAGTARMAAAGQMGLASAADISTNVMKGFGKKSKDISHISDVLAKSATSANTTINEMGNAMSYAAPAAKSAGISIEEAAAMVGMFSDAGIKGSRAGTALRMGLAKIVDPSKEAAKTIEKLGVQVTDSSGKMKPFREIIKDLNDAGMSTADAFQIFGRRAGPAIMAVADRGGEALGKFTEQLKNSGGTAKSISDTQMSGLYGSLKKIQGAFETFAITLGGTIAPAVKKIGGVLTSLLQKFQDLPEPVQKAIGVVAALGTAAAAIGGPMLMLIGFMPQIVSGAKMAVGGLKMMTSFMGGPYTIAIMAAIAAAYLIYKNWDKIVAGLKKVWGAMESAFTSVWGNIKSVLQAAFGFIKKYWRQIISVILGPLGVAVVLIAKYWDEISGAIKAAVKPIVDFVKPKFEAIKDAIVGAWKAVYKFTAPKLSAIKDVIVKAWDAIVSKTKLVFSPLVDFFTGVWDKISSGVSAAVTAIKTPIKEAWGWIYSHTVKVFQDIYNFLFGWSWGDDIIAGFASMVSKMTQPIKDAWSTIESTFTKMGDKVKKVFSGIWTSLGTIAKNGINSIIGGINALIGGLESALNSVRSGLKSFPTFDVPDWVPGIGGKGFSLPLPPKVELPEIPSLARGGYIPETGLYNLHKGESVVPAPTPQAGGGTPTIIVYNYMDGTEIASKTVTRIDKKARLQGAYS